MKLVLQVAFQDHRTALFINAAYAHNATYKCFSNLLQADKYFEI